MTNAPDAHFMQPDLSVVETAPAGPATLTDDMARAVAEDLPVPTVETSEIAGSAEVPIEPPGVEATQRCEVDAARAPADVGKAAVLSSLETGADDRQPDRGGDNEGHGDKHHDHGGDTDSHGGSEEQPLEVLSRYTFIGRAKDTLDQADMARLDDALRAETQRLRDKLGAPPVTEAQKVQNEAIWSAIEKYANTLGLDISSRQLQAEDFIPITQAQMSELEANDKWKVNPELSTTTGLVMGIGDQAVYTDHRIEVRLHEGVHMAGHREVRIALSDNQEIDLQLSVTGIAHCEFGSRHRLLNEYETERMTRDIKATYLENDPVTAAFINADDPHEGYNGGEMEVGDYIHHGIAESLGIPREEVDRLMGRAYFMGDTRFVDDILDQTFGEYGLMAIAQWTGLFEADNAISNKTVLAELEAYRQAQAAN